MEIYDAVNGGFIASGTATTLSGGTRAGAGFNDASFLGASNTKPTNVGYYLSTAGTIERHTMGSGALIGTGTATALSGGTLNGTLFSDTSRLIDFGTRPSDTVAYYLGMGGTIEFYDADTGVFLGDFGETSVTGGLADGETYEDLFSQGRLLGASHNGESAGNRIYIATAAVPEPASLLLCGAGLGGLALRRRRRRKTAAAG